MNDGWIKLHRQSIKNGWIKNHKLWVFWTYCLLKANYEETDVVHGNQKIHLSPGEFIFGRKVASKETGLSERSIRTCLHNLKKLKNLTIKTTNKFSIITICNWRVYQSDTIPQPTIKTTKDRPATDQQPTTNKKNKNIRREEIKDFCSKNPHADKIVQTFLSTMDEEDLYRPKTESQKLEWLQCAQWAIDKMGKYGDEKVVDIIEHFRDPENADNGKFNWADNFRTLLKLKRKNPEGITYLEYFWEKAKEEFYYGEQKKENKTAGNFR